MHSAAQRYFLNLHCLQVSVDFAQLTLSKLHELLTDGSCAGTIKHKPMKIAIMQPYFFPYLGYFQLINSVDRFVLGDEVQYIYQGWINRNRILKPDKDGFSYIMIPVVKESSKSLIKDVVAVEGNEWKNKIIRQLDHYRKKSPYYSKVYELVTDCFTTRECSITKLNAVFLKAVCDYIGISYKVEIQSDMQFDYSDIHDTCERPIKMCEQMGATEYINPVGGKELYDAERFEAKNIKLRFFQSRAVEYFQNRNGFEPSLSIIDVMMFNSACEIKSMLNECQLI